MTPDVLAPAHQCEQGPASSLWCPMPCSQEHSWASLLRMRHNALMLRLSGFAYRLIASLAVPHL